MAKVKIYMELLERDEKDLSFSELLKKRWTQYFLDNHGRVSQNDFAEYLGEVGGANLSNYMTGVRRPLGPQIVKLADKLGPIVYDKLDLPRNLPRDPLLLQVVDNWDLLSEKEQQELLDKMMEIKHKKEAKGKALNNRNAFA